MMSKYIDRPTLSDMLNMKHYKRMADYLTSKGFKFICAPDGFPLITWSAWDYYCHGIGGDKDAKEDYDWSQVA